MVLGGFSFMELGVDFFPKVDFPTVVVTTALPGSGPREIETQVTKVIEEAVNTIEGIDELRSTSFDGLSQVVVVFKLYRNPDIGAQDVRDRVGRVLADLPDGIDPPIIEKFDMDAMPVLNIVVSGAMEIRELTEFAKKRIKENIESVAGVGQVLMVGGREREIHIEVDPTKLIAYGVTTSELKQAIRSQNIEVPGGLVEGLDEDLLVRTVGRIKKVEDFENIVIREVQGTPILLSAVSDCVDSQQEERTMARLNGVNAISLTVQKQSGTNTVAVVEAIKKRLETLRATIPKEIELSVVRDQSRFILASFHSIMEHLILGSLLAGFVVLIFLGSVRTTIIASIAIPTSLVATFTLMHFKGFTLNQISMLALTLAVGIVIDDAIVVLENIFRYIDEEGADPVTAAKEGTGEIALAVLATSASLIVMFVPVAFMPGIVGRFLNSFGLTMAFAIAVSVLISFVLTPPMCAILLRKKPEGESVEKKEDWIDRFITAPYIWILEKAMRHRWVIVIIGLLCVVATVPLGKAVGKDFIPKDDQSEFLVNIIASEGSSLSKTSRLLGEIEAELRTYESVNILLTTIGEKVGAGTNEGQIYVGMKELEEREMGQFDLMAKTRHFIQKKYPHLRASVSVVPQISGGGMRQVDLDLAIQGPNIQILEESAQEILKLLNGLPGVVDLDTSLSEGKPELEVEVDRIRAASLGVNLLDLAGTLRTLVGGDEEKVTRYKDPEQNEEYEVRVRLAPKFRKNIEDLSVLPIRARSGLLPLGSLATIRRARGPTKIERYGRQRMVSIFANLKGIGLGEAQDLINQRMEKMELPPGYNYSYLGRSKAMKEQQQGFLLAFAMSTIFMYIILAAQFESLIHPITILIALPACVPFGILSLIVTGEMLNLYSTLGLFMLFGIVKKNAILQVDYANTLRERGMDMLPAIMESNKTRLRPIIMTTLTLIAGMLPVAFGQGPGASSRRSLAIVVIGGQVLCLLITLLLTPVVYSLFDEMANSRVVKWAQGLIK
jgi:HAE1 family hydrophobic/amphiphilic exporter-1